MGTYVTPDGFITPTYTENKEYWEGVFKVALGQDIDLDPTGPIGQLVAQFSKRDTDLFEAAAEVYYSRDPDQAEGVALDAICSETGVIRIAEGRTTVDGVLLYGDLGVTIPAGVQARQGEGENQDILYSLLGDVDIELADTRDVTLQIDTNPSAGIVYTINIDGTDYSFTAVGGESKDDIAQELYDLIVAGTWAGETTLDGANIILQQFNADFAVTITSTIIVDLIACAGSFQADVAGQYPLPENTLNTIATGTSGWNDVINPTAGTTGRAKETDPELRIRRAQTLVTGNATEDALVAAISNNVPGVSRVSVQSNRTMDVNSENMPPKSFELIINGGSAQAIGDEIWATQGAGIASHGTIDVDVVDSEGRPQVVYFSRPEAVYLHVLVQRSKYSEEEYPTDGDDQIKRSIVDWSELNQTIGKDVIRQRLNTPIYEVPGIEDLEIFLATSATPEGTPTAWVQDNVDITNRQFADFDIDRITVEDIP